jgi:ABC-type proline/glycine betaine transport system permease subunit
MLRGLLIALTLGWELYAVVAVSDAGVGFIDVALTIPSACLLALAWALP